MAIKIHRDPLRGADLVAFRREFTVLAERPHPSLLRVYECGFHAGLPYVVLELARGGDAVALRGKLSAERLRDVAHDLLEALEHLHRQGLLHRDLKPGNLLVKNTPRGPALRIADLGLTASIGEESTAIAGTAGYLAPEYLDRAPPSVRTDLFALGACLYELATGTPAFPGADAVQTMLAARRGGAMQIRAGFPQVPEDVEDLLQRLLEPRPSRRPASAREALEILDPKRSPSAGRLIQPILIGRSEELRTIRAVLTLSARRAVPHWAFFQAPSGRGLSRLFAEAAILGQRLHASVLRFSPASGEDGRAALARALFAAELDRRDEKAGGPVADQADWGVIDSVVRALDAGRGVPGGDHCDVPGGDHYALVHAFGTVLRELSARRRTLLLIDAPASATEVTERLLAALVGSVPSGKLAVVAGAQGKLLARRPPYNHFRGTLAALTWDQTRELLQSHLSSGCLSGQFVDTLHEFAQGSPAKTLDGVKALLRAGQLRRDGRWSAELPGVHFRIPESSDHDAPELPAELSATERAIANALAVLGEADAETLAKVAEYPLDGLGATLSRFECEGFVEHREDRSGVWGDLRFRFTDRATPKQLLTGLRKQERFTLHQRAAEALQAAVERQKCSEGARTHTRIAAHWAECGRAKESRAALEQAGRLWRSLQLHLEEAEALGAYVADFDGIVDRELIEDLRLDWGDALERAGSATEAESALDPVLRSQNPLNRARAAASLAKVLIGSQRTAEAETVIRTGLVALDAISAEQGDGVRVLLLHRLGLVHLERGQIEPCLSALTRAEALTRSLPDGREQRARLMTTCARVDLERGNLAVAASSYRAALAVFVELGDERRATACEVALGAVYWQRAEYEHAVGYFRDAADRSRRTHDLRAHLVALSNQALAQGVAGAWAEAMETHRDVLSVATSVGDDPARLRTFNNLGSLLRDRGELRRSRAMLEEGVNLARELGDRSSEAALEGNLGELALIEGNPQEGRHHLGVAAAFQVQQAAERGAPHLLTDTAGIEALRRIAAWEIEHGDPTMGRGLVAMALRAAGRIGSHAERAHLLALGATIAERRYQTQRALGRYARARRVMEKLSLQHAAHRVDLKRAEILHSMRRHGAARAVLEHALEGLERLGALIDHSHASRLMMEIDDDAPSLGERTSRMPSGDHLLWHLLDITLQINAIHELPPLLDLIAQKTIELTGGRRALLFLKDEKTKKTELAASASREEEKTSAADYSQTFVEDVFNKGVALIVTDMEDAADLARRSSIKQLDLRFIVGVPVANTEGVIGVIYVDDDRTVRDVGRDELFVLQSLANQAALAIRNARLFERATVDALTHVSMRHYFLQRAAEDLARMRSMGAPFALLMIDIDHFKLVNDDFGHATGDMVLAKVAAVIRRFVPTSGSVGRLGGEEFAVVFPGMNVAAAYNMADRIRARIEESAMLKERTITCSVGVAAFGPANDDPIETLLSAADDALYEAKRSGRNCVEVADSVGLRRD